MDINEYKPSATLEEHGVEVNDDTFCIMPFVHMSTTTNGEYRLCCRSKKIATSKSAPATVWNTDEYNKVRSDLINGVRNERCDNCWRLEDNGIISLRQSQNFARTEKFAEYVKEWVETGELEWKVPVVELKLSNICNLRCRMCWPKDSTPWVRDWDAVQHIHDDGTQEYIGRIMDDYDLRKKPMLTPFNDNPKFVKQIIDNLAYVEELEFAGGEPLLDPLHYKIINEVPNPENVILKYSTNLTDLEFKRGRNILDIWKQFKAIRLTISIDGDESLNNVVRYGTDWSAVRENIKIVKKELGDKLITIRATTTISAMNVLHLPETMDAVTGDLNVQWHTSRLTYPEFLHANVIHPDELRKQIIRLNEKRDVYMNELKSILHDKKKSVFINAMIRHIDDSIRWIESCISNNKHDKLYNKFIEYTSIMDSIDKKNERI